MRMISEQVKELRNMAHGMKVGGYDGNILIKILNKAADTIETLSAKLQAANMERLEDCGGWIPCKERLPEKCVMNPITNDYAEYLCTVCVDGYMTVRLIKFDRDGCWVNHGMNFDKYVTAWQPLPEPYHEP